MIREGFYEDAINKCIDYIENYGGSSEQIANLKCIIGWTYLIDLNNSHLAKEAFIEAIESDEKCGRAYTGLGIYEANNENDGENYFALAICYKELNKFELVEEYLVKANAIEPEDNRIIEEYAYELLRQGRNDEAIEYLKEIAHYSKNKEEIKSLVWELEQYKE